MKEYHTENNTKCPVHSNFVKTGSPPGVRGSCAKLYKKWKNIIDVDLSIYFKNANVDSAFNKLKEIFFETLNGRDTLSEKENYGEILIPYKSELL